MEDKNATFLAQKTTISNVRLCAMFALILLAFAAPTFAWDYGGASGITTLDSWGDKIIQIFTSSWVKAILVIALIIEAVCLVMAGQQGGGSQMLKRFGPWIIGTIILLSASGICDFFFSNASD